MERMWCLSCETKDMVVLLAFLCAGCCLYFVNKQKHTVIGPFIVLIPTGCPSPPSVLPHENLVYSQGSLLPCRVSGQHTLSGRVTCVSSQRPTSSGQALPGSWAWWWGSEALSQEPGEIACLWPQKGTRGDANYAYVYGLKWKKKSTKKQNQTSGYISGHRFISDIFFPDNSHVFQVKAVWYLLRILQWE